MNFEKLNYFVTWGLIFANFFSPTKANYIFSFSLSGRNAGELTGQYLEIQITHDYCNPGFPLHLETWTDKTNLTIYGQNLKLNYKNKNISLAVLEQLQERHLAFE